MNDPMLDILRGLAKRQAATAGKKGGQCSIVDSGYEKNEEIQQEVEAVSADTAAEIAPIPTSDTVKSSEIAEILGFESGSKNLRTHEINEFNEKTQGCADRPAAPAWEAGLALLDPDLPPADVPPKRWRQLITDCGRLSVEGVFEKAAQLGWTEIDLFGCDNSKPFARIDQQGLVWLVTGWRVVMISPDAAILEAPTGAKQTFRRRPGGPGRALVWELPGRGQRSAFSDEWED